MDTKLCFPRTGRTLSLVTRRRATTGRNGSSLHLSLRAARPRQRPAEPEMGDGHDLHYDEPRLRLSGDRARLGHASCACLAPVQQLDGRSLCRGAGKSDPEIRPAVNREYGSRQPVHQLGLHQRARIAQHSSQHGWQGLLAGRMHSLSSFGSQSSTRRFTCTVMTPSSSFGRP